MNRAVKYVYSNPDAVWQEKRCGLSENADVNLEVSETEHQVMQGFGGCFNELGFEALKSLSKSQTDQLMQELFGDFGAGFNFGRLPIGANDYSLSWYSLDETDGDYALRDFTIERDKSCLIPYIKMALAVRPDMKLFASPWSPPTWMKNPKVYNYGKIIWKPEILKAYADYFIKFIRAYGRENIRIDQVHIQNEPVADQKFPSCVWTGGEMRDFIKYYLGPAFKEAGIDTEIWLGTINAPGCDFKRLLFERFATEDYDYFANTVLMDPDARKYIKGVSYQWGGKFAIQRTNESWGPRIRLMQTENECGVGDNSWEYARYNFTQMKHYIGNGAESYIYWNIVLLDGQKSTWGDSQNSLVSIDRTTGGVRYNPDFYLMKHFSAAVKRGAVRLGTQGPWSGDSLAFRNTDGETVLVIMNPFDKRSRVSFRLEGSVYGLEMEPLSFNTVTIR